MVPSIIVRNVSKRYFLGQTHADNMLREALVDVVTGRRGFLRRRPELWALRDVSFAVDPGTLVGIIGRNGAGKSTLLKVLSRITCPTEGKVTVRGRVASLLEVGTGFHEELTGRENVYLNGSILGMRKREIDSKLDAIIEFAGVEKFVDTPIKRYSTGMRLRLGFAVAAHLDSDVLFVDEVLAVGDAEFQKRCLSAMENIRGEGRTLLFVSHNMSAIQNFCGRAIWIDGGRIRRDGETGAVLRDYMSTFARPTANGASLRDFEPRTGTGSVRFTGVEFLTPERGRKDLLRSGDSIVFRLNYLAKQTVLKPCFGLQIDSALGATVSAVSTWGMGVPLAPLSPGDGAIDLEIDFLNLTPGRYYLSLSISTDGPVWHDYLDHCVAFDVETSDPCGTGRGLDGRQGIVFFPCRWRTRESGSFTFQYVSLPKLA